MARIIIDKFCCIDAADLELTPLTVLIGPQASGKSIISKLIHFFYDAIGDIYEVDFKFEERTFGQYSELIVERFKKSFPSQAWGESAFKIEFVAGPIHIKLWRSKPKSGSPGRLRLEMSDILKEIFDASQEELRIASEKVTDSRSNKSLPKGFEISWRISRTTRSKLQKAMESDFISNQLFIPAGRSFFTSMGKAVIAFEHGGFLDPLTIAFGRIFLAMRDSLSGRSMFLGAPRNEKNYKEILNLQEKISEDLFSGKIKVEKNEEYIEATDGRKIPFSIMSSGQQELLPLWLTLNQFFDGDSPNNFVYIEEPEAHLFPLAQSTLTEYFATLLGSSVGQKMLITTHSPYILAKVNNLLKAGNITAKTSRKIQNGVEAIVPKLAWLKPGSTSAYAIINRKVIRIIGDDGLIDGEYLDEVSGEISKEFNRLLEIEYSL